MMFLILLFFFSSRRRHTRFSRDWSSDVCSSDLLIHRQGVTLIGVAVSNLDDDNLVQPELPFDRRADLDAALDEVRRRFGSAAVTRAVLLGRDPGLAVPLLPD